MLPRIVQVAGFFDQFELSCRGSSAAVKLILSDQMEKYP